MTEAEWLAEQFERNRAHLRAAAFRMLGSGAEADDAVQESWLRLSRSDTSAVQNLGGWLTTVTARVCLDMLRARKSRREELFETELPEPVGVDHAEPEDEALLADAIGPALLVVLDTLTPAERLAFVLHDMFDVPFDEIAPIVRRSPAATRQLASRARRRVQGAAAKADLPRQPDLPRQRSVVAAFLTAARGGDFDGLLSLLDPDVVLRGDDAVVAIGGVREVCGAVAVAGTFAGRATVAQPALVNGSAGAVWVRAGRPRVVFAFTINDAIVAEIEMIADANRIAALDLVISDAGVGSTR